MSATPTKLCRSCGRRFEWRRKWARTWPEVRYCSTACRRRGIGSADRALEAAIVGLLARRRPDATICPSEAARHVAGDGDWRRLLEPARRAARRLAAAGRVRVTQRGRVVDPTSVRGPIRLARVR